MNYFVRKEDTIEKYLVEFDREELEKLKLEIIENCSLVKHHEYDGIDGPDSFDYLRIRNYREVKIGSIEINREFGEMADIYHFSYDEYEFPQLVTIIDNLLAFDLEAIEKIMNPDYSSFEKEPLREMIQSLSAEIDKISNWDPKQKIEKLKMLEQLFDRIELNTNRDIKPVEPYYRKVKNLLKVELVDSINIEDLLKVQNFFEIELNNIGNLDKHKQKILTMKTPTINK